MSLRLPVRSEFRSRRSVQVGWAIAMRMVSRRRTEQIVERFRANAAEVLSCQRLYIEYQSAYMLTMLRFRSSMSL